jgi:hypothetical protein
MRTSTWTAIATLLTLVVCSCSAGESTYYVAPNGNDAWSGKLAEPNKDGTDGPFKTLSKAVGVVQPGDACQVRKGVYRETLTPAGDGTAEKPIVFKAYEGETPVISGTDELTGWRTEEAGGHLARMEWDLGDQNQLFAGGVMLDEVRWPANKGTLLQPTRAVAEAGTANTLTDSKLEGGDDAYKGATLWCAGGERWICWSATITKFDAKTKTLTFEKPQPDRWYTPRKGSEYVLMGGKTAFSGDGQWRYERDAKTLTLYSRKAPAGVDAKRRLFAMDLSGRSHIQVIGLHFRAGGILTNEKTSHVLLKNLKGEYVGHSYVNDVSDKAGVLIRGSHIELNSCEFAFASGSIVRITGNDNRLVNCFIHDGCYGGKWNGTVAVAGRRHLVSHNTICDSGRDLVSIHRLMESLIQYNDLSNAGWITADLGMTYGHDTDFMGTVIRYNWVHDNKARGHSVGIYFDHLSHNCIVHNNVVWNVNGPPLQINNPSYFMLGFNNTFWRTRELVTFDHSHRNDLFGCRVQNNICNRAIKLPEHVVKENNLVAEEPPLVDAANRKFALKAGSPASAAGVPLKGVTDAVTTGRPDLGAYQSGQPEWKAGHDFKNPPNPKWDLPDNIAYSNAVKNAAFETGTVECWTKTGDGKAETSKGNGWGNEYGKSKPEKTGTSRFELRLSGKTGVEQTISGLHPNTAYQLSGWLKVGDEKDAAVLGVKGYGGADKTAASSSKEWTRVLVEFTTGANNTSAVVFIAKTSDGAGQAFADNVGLPRVPAGK